MKNIPKIMFSILLLSFLLVSTDLVLAVKTPPPFPIGKHLIKNKEIKKEVKVSPKPPIKKPIVQKSLPENPSHVNGIITEIDLNTITLSIEKKGKDKTLETKVITLGEKTIVNRDFEKLTLTDLKVGDNVHIALVKKGNTYVTKSIRIMTENTLNIIKDLRAKKNN
jgi:hypothetical protein